MNLRLFLTLVFAGLVLLKAAGLTTLSWWIVLLPFTVILVVLAGCGGLFAIAGLIAGYGEMQRRHRISSR